MVSEKGTCQVKGENEEVGRGEESIHLEDIAGEAEDGVLILIEDEETMSAGSETMSMEGVSFLDCIQEEERDEELEMRLEGMRKRKHDGEEEVKTKGLLNTPGWEEREKDGKGEERWVMGKREWRVDGDGKKGKRMGRGKRDG